MDQISVDDMRRVAEKARRPYTPVQGNCGDIVDRFENLLIDEAGLPYKSSEVTEMYGRRHVRVGPKGEEKHYVLEIDGELVSGFASGETIWVDLSFDQFNERNKNDETTPIEVSYGKKSELDSFRVMASDDPRRASQYSRVGELF